MVNKTKNAFTLADVLITLVVIGVVAALTIPPTLSKFQTTQAETRLKKSYSTLANAVKRAEVDHGSISLWDYSDVNNFVTKYITPYVANIKNSTNEHGKRILYLSDGTSWIFERESSFKFIIDINGDSKPNKNGYDRFIFHLFPRAAGLYNGGNGDIARNVPSAGIYPDGYGIPKWYLLANQYRGCNDWCTYGTYTCGAYCTVLIVSNGWKIPDDYPFNL